MSKLSLAALNSREELTATRIDMHPQSQNTVIVTFFYLDEDKKKVTVKAMASIAKHFDGEDPLFLDDSNRLLNNWEVKNDWVLPVGGGKGLTLG